MKIKMNILLAIALILVSYSLTQAQGDPFAPKEDPFAPKEEQKKEEQKAKEGPKAVTVANKPTSVLTKSPKFDNYIKDKLAFSIPVISVPEFKALIKKNKSVIVLDARGVKAFETSHLRRAKRVGTSEDFSIERIWMYRRDAPIVIYATVGKESEEIGNTLRKLGFTNVHNLYGSIIEWVNQNGNLVNNKGRATLRIGIIKNENEAKAFLEKGQTIAIKEAKY